MSQQSTPSERSFWRHTPVVLAPPTEDAALKAELVIPREGIREVEHEAGLDATGRTLEEGLHCFSAACNARVNCREAISRSTVGVKGSKDHDCSLDPLQVPHVGLSD